ncbi:palH/RIM21 domain-containing protein [Hirsutella rhossiliensis]|uniref:PalH/RIM21 domain-containing protein n=1 Tax=Hirsutella rhossiliensis TaxID=111463 RepID=A0A9P8MQ49_9HYPO|nr:palH/RIM21 domain-containing protein [Hirsutella rhossiliensis]KAH0959109.1 palH/RIM21 domain-containing protein [Hirsutella rhossiliensis]
MEILTLGMTTITAAPTLCTTTVVPASGLLTMANAPPSVTLAQAVVYEVPCPTAKPLNAMALVASEGAGDAKPNMGDSSDTRFSDFRDPFYASTFPICYALAATTVTAYMLLIMLFITPRSFLDGGVVYLGRRRGFTHSSSGGESIGGRPWLQKVAALTVAVSLTIATHDTFKVAQRQYQWGAQNAGVLQSAVMGSIELRVIRLISNTFLWLAQAQTLIRLFPRHREKVIIKWAAFALITLDLIFSAINSFKDREKGSYPNPMGGGSFDHPIPALSYLFQLLLGVLYAAWVIYYSLMKKRYAFYHPLMKNMPFLAVISLTAILVPVVFFIMDISKPEFTGWGDYVRWVGAAAASVIVWEEVFDGDETLEVNASEFPWLRSRKTRKDDGGHGGGGADSAITGRQRGQARDAHETRQQQQQQAPRTMGDILLPPLWPARPAPAATPVSRTDTPSAASTVYAVRYQATSDATSRTPDPLPPEHSVVELGRQTAPPTATQNGIAAQSLPRRSTDLEASASPEVVRPSQWRTLTLSTSPHPRGEIDEPLAEVRKQATRDIAEPTTSRDAAGRWDVRSRFELFAANQAEKLREKLRPTTDTDSLPVTVIPAPPRRGAALQQVLEEGEEASEEMARLGRLESSTSAASGGNEALLPAATNPPLWPGVRRRVLTFEGDDSSLYDGSTAETASVESERRESEDEPRGPSRGPAAIPRQE